MIYILLLSSHHVLSWLSFWFLLKMVKFWRICANTFPMRGKLFQIFPDPDKKSAVIFVRKCRVTSIYYNSIKHGLQLSWTLVNIKLGRNSGSLNIPSIDRIVTFEVAFKFLISNCFCDKVNRFFHACVLRNAFGKSEKNRKEKKFN